MRKLLTVAALSAALLMLVAEPVLAGGRRGGGGCSGGGCGGGYYGGGCAGGNCGGGYMGGYAYGGGCAGGLCQITPTGTGTATAGLQQPARLLVSLPAEASLTIDGFQTKSTSAQRLFTTPALEVGKSFTYTLKAQVERDGKPETVTRVVTVRGGEQTRVDLDFNASVAADE
jgi:uncharacterized protein (TIGR03000 family)